MKNGSKLSQSIPFLLFLGACYFLLFSHLGSRPLHLWDEAVFAVNAFDMIQEGSYFIRYFDGSPVLWNPKPPLVTWVHILMMKLLGYQELAVRIPSAIAGLLTILGIIWFCRHTFNSLTMGYFCGLILLCSSGFIHKHVTRTGCVDAPLALFTLGYILSFYKLLHTSAFKKYLFLTSLFILLSLFTKSIQGLLFIPALVIYLIYQRKFKWLFNQPLTYSALGVIILITLTYYGIVDYLHKGYLEEVWKRELWGRFTDTRSQHKGAFLFYFNYMSTKAFTPWIYFIPFTGLFTYFLNNKSLQRFLFYLLICFLTYGLLISLAQTKLPWYSAPLYPVGALLIGITIFIMYKILLNYFNISSYKKKLIIGACFGVTLFLSPYLTILEKVQTSRLPNKNMRYGEAMKYMHKNYPQVKQYKAIVNAVAHPQIVFYKRRYNKEGYKITSEQLNNIKTGDTVLICHDPLLRKLNQRYRTKTALNPEKCKLLKVKSKR